MVITWRFIFLLVAIVLMVAFVLVAYEVWTVDHPFGWLGLSLLSFLVSELPVPTPRRGGARDV